MATNFVSMKIEAVQNNIGTPCLICGEAVPVLYNCYSPKICEKCKAAVMKAREQDGK